MGARRPHVGDRYEGLAAEVRPAMTRRGSWSALLGWPWQGLSIARHLQILMFKG